MNMSMNMSLSNERNSKRKTANFSRCVCLPELTEMSQIIEMDYQNRPQYFYVDCIWTGWPSIVTESVESENYGARFGQMKLLSHENVNLYGGGDNLLTCLRECM